MFYVSHCSKRFTLHPLADLLIAIPTRLLWEAFRHAAITASRLFTHISTALYSQVFIFTAEWTGALWRTKMTKLRNSSKGDSNPGSLDWVQHSTGELRHSAHQPKNITRALSIECSILPVSYGTPHINLRTSPGLSRLSAAFYRWATALHTSTQEHHPGSLDWVQHSTGELRHSAHQPKNITRALSIECSILPVSYGTPHINPRTSPGLSRLSAEFYRWATALRTSTQEHHPGSLDWVQHSTGELRHSAHQPKNITRALSIECSILPVSYGTPHINPRTSMTPEPNKYLQIHLNQ